MRSAPLALTLALALALTGCVSNMGDLKSKLGQGEGDEPVAPASTTETTTPTSTEAIVAAKPPVARITIFGPNGALIFKSSFQAEDATDLLYVQEDAELSLIASDSEALQSGATLTGFAWSLNDVPIEGSRQAKVAVPDAGLYVITLNVTDSNGKSDTQVVKLAVAPTPIDVVTELVTGAIVGASGTGQPGEATFTLALADSGVANATIQKVVFHAATPETCDAVLDVVGPDGKSLGPEDSGSVGEAETIETAALPEGSYAISVAPFACLAPEGVPVTVTVTYLPIVEGLPTGDEHDDHAH